MAGRVPAITSTLHTWKWRKGDWQKFLQVFSASRSAHFLASSTKETGKHNLQAPCCLELQGLSTVWAADRYLKGVRKVMTGIMPKGPVLVSVMRVSIYNKPVFLSTKWSILSLSLSILTYLSLAVCANYPSWMSGQFLRRPTSHIWLSMGEST